MLYAGLDLSRRRLDFCLLDRAGQAVEIGATLTLRVRAKRIASRERYGEWLAPAPPAGNSPRCPRTTARALARRRRRSEHRVLETVVAPKIRHSRPALPSRSRQPLGDDGLRRGVDEVVEEGAIA